MGDTYSFKAFGETVATTGTIGAYQRYGGEVGYQLDHNGGGWWARARSLQPSQGRWMSRDPLGFGGGPVQPLNAYPYVDNDPTDWVDPEGFKKRKPKRKHPAKRGDDDPKKPPICPAGQVPVYITCYPKGPGKDTAVYCHANDVVYFKRVGKKRVPCYAKDFCRDRGYTLGAPVFPRGTTICIHDGAKAMQRTVNDCGCGPKLAGGGKWPQPDNWIDIGQSPAKCPTWRNRWVCVAVGPCPKKGGA